MSANLLEEMKKFAERKKLSKKGLVRYYDDFWPFLHVEDPIVLARFAALLKQKVYRNNKEGWVYCRGQCSHHKSMLPSLFRGDNQKYPVSTLMAAQEDLMEKIKENFKLKRFETEDLPALLQHYGMRTSWLDLVDNLYVAVWFATNSIEARGEKSFVEENKNGYGWIYFVSNAALPKSQLRCVDLRMKHHSLSVRPHAQHGISVTRSSQWNNENKDLINYVVATVRFPIADKWRLSGYMGSPKYLFPNSSFDNTLKYLQGEELSRIIRSIEDKYKLAKGSLGSVNLEAKKQ